MKDEQNTQIQVPPIIMAAEASAEAEFWRNRSLTNAYLRYQAEQELASLKKEKAKKTGGE